jgi:hypothetical protein
MITHYIYHLPGIKVGCTKDLEKRKQYYPRHRTRMLQVLEVLHDKTDQEAGDRERWWNDHFGYRRYVHYVHTIAAGPIGGQSAVERGVGIHALTTDQRIANGRMGGRRYAETTTPERRSENARIAATKTTTPEGRSENARKRGRRVAQLGIGIHALTPEQRSENSRKAGCSMRDHCPHCGLESNRPNLVRYHFDNCPHKIEIKWHITRPDFSSRAELHG